VRRNINPRQARRATSATNLATTRELNSSCYRNYLITPSRSSRSKLSIAGVAIS
jgi:hypothetical protein